MKFASPLLLICFLLASLVWVGCSNNVETPSIDCSLSDLEILVESQVDSDCGDPGSFTVSASGGNGTYEFSVDGLNFQSSTVLAGLSAGNYTLIVRDGDGCTATIAATLQAASGSVSLDVASSNTTCGSDQGSITVSASGGVEPYEFSLNGGTSQTSNVFNGLTNGSKTVAVVDADGCEVSQSVLIASGVSLSTDIMPIITANCAVTGCHNGSRFPDLRSSANVMGNASRIMARTSAGTMPPAGRTDLTQDQIAKISCWVDDGAPNN